jgi:exonuclease V gamma subunit
MNTKHITQSVGQFFWTYQMSLPRMISEQIISLNNLTTQVQSELNVNKSKWLPNHSALKHACNARYWSQNQFMTGQYLLLNVMPMRSIPKLLSLGPQWWRIPEAIKCCRYVINCQHESQREDRGDDRYLFLEAPYRRVKILYLSLTVKDVIQRIESQVWKAELLILEKNICLLKGFNSHCTSF